MALKTARVAGLLALAVAGSAAAAQSPREEACDRLRPVSSALGYQLRASSPRCEGLYESAVRAIGLEVVGLVAGTIVPDLAEHAEVEIVGPDPADLPAGVVGPLRVRAVALPLKAYYRMDAVLDPSSKLAWPIAEVVKPAGLGPDQIGVFGWIGEETEKTFVPVGVRVSGESGGAKDLHLYVRVTSDAERLYWRFREGAAESDWMPAAEGRVRSGQTVVVTLPPGQEAVIGIDVTAKPVDSDEWTSLRFNALRVVP